MGVEVRSLTRDELEPAWQLDRVAFASLYSGWAQTATLARAGLLQGGSAVERALLDAAFAGSTPWLSEEL